MRGIEYVVDDSGRKKAVIIDLEEWGDLWEDFCDILVSEVRRGEPTVRWEGVRAETMKK